MTKKEKKNIFKEGVLRVKEMAVEYYSDVIKSSDSARRAIVQAFDPSGLIHEEVWCLFLNRANRPIRVVKISQGSEVGTVVSTKIIAAHAVACMANAVILAHNHPSGNLKPSQADLDITKKVKGALELLEVKTLDHLILSPYGGYLSFMDEGYI